MAEGQPPPGRAGKTARDVEDAYRTRGRDRARHDGDPGTVETEAPTFPCPEDGCSIRFACDACLDEHLRSVHEASYGAVFGDVSTAWLTLCKGHTGFPVDRLAATA